jgi:hypothetical protein
LLDWEAYDAWSLYVQIGDVAEGFHYDCTEQGDVYDFQNAAGFGKAYFDHWDGERDTLEEHNDFDLITWGDTLMPATQCGKVACTVVADGATVDVHRTALDREDLCSPVGSRGGN